MSQIDQAKADVTGFLRFRYVTPAYTQKIRGTRVTHDRDRHVLNCDLEISVQLSWQWCDGKNDCSFNTACPAANWRS